MSSQAPEVDDLLALEAELAEVGAATRAPAPRRLAAAAVSLSTERS